MQPFRDLIKPDKKFEWNDELQHLFEETKDVLIKQCIEGIKDIRHYSETWLQTDWSHDGNSYLLLQKYYRIRNGESI